MQIGYIAILDGITMGFLLIAISYFAIFYKNTSNNQIKILVLFLLSMLFLYSLAMFLKWTHISVYFEEFEDLIGALIPVFFAFVFYSFIQQHNHATIAANELRLRLAINATRSGLWDWNIKTDELVITDSWFELLGYTPQELNPFTIATWESFVHPDDLLLSNNLLDKHINGEVDTYECVVRMHHKNGSWIWMQDKGKIVELDINGKALHMIGTLIDVTEQKNLEINLKAQVDENVALNEEYITQNEELNETLKNIQQMNVLLEESKEKAEESDRLKSAFLANISHEIRTPLNGIVGFSQLIVSPDIDSNKQETYAEFIMNSSNQLLSVVNDILDISSIQAGDIQVKESKLNLNDFCNRLFDDYNKLAQSKGLQLFLNVPSYLNSLFFIDKYRLEQIVSKLLNNAIKYTKVGFVTFGYSTSDNAIKFFIKDTGVGIEEEDYSVIFEPFRQGKIRYGEIREGTGLGLAIAHQLIHIMGGNLWFESQVGVGSTFSFMLPVKGVYTSGESSSLDKPQILHNISLIHILVVEDEDVNYLFLKELLSSYNIVLYRAVNGKEAVDIVSENNDFDIVLMDINMPIMNGYEASRLIKINRPKIPIVFQTAFVLEQDRLKAYEVGCDACLAKPLSRTELFLTIEQYSAKKIFKK